MSIPTKDDPFGMRPNPTSITEMLESVVDARIELRLHGRSRPKFDGVTDAELAMELIARGWAVFLPKTSEKS